MYENANNMTFQTNCKLAVYLKGIKVLKKVTGITGVTVYAVLKENCMLRWGRIGLTHNFSFFT